MKRALIATNHMQTIAGSEMVALEIAEYFVDLGYQTYLLANSFSQKVRELAPEKLILTSVLKDVTQISFDFVWAQHHMLPLIFEEIGILGSHESKIVSAHLSSYVPLEKAGITAAMLLGAIIVVNSEETLASLRKLGIADEHLINFKNAAPAKFIRSATHTKSELETLLIVSNHPPNEVLEAADILRTRGVKVDILGRKHNLERLTPEKLQQFDAVLTIGKTVQYAILRQLLFTVTTILAAQGGYSNPILKALKERISQVGAVEKNARPLKSPKA